MIRHCRLRPANPAPRPPPPPLAPSTCHSSSHARAGPRSVAAAASPLSPSTSAPTNNHNNNSAPHKQLDDEDDVAMRTFPSAAPGHFDDTSTSFLEEFPVRGCEVSPNQKASVVTVANLLQELAANHAVGMWGRAEKGFAGLPNTPNIIFVMMRLQIRMYQYPKWGDILTFQTFFSSEGRLSARRDWVITDSASGQQLGAATSSWVNINMDTRRLTKLPDDLRAKFMRFAWPSERHALPAEETKKKLPEVDEQRQVAGPLQIARRSDMDMNGHINNVVYVAWALESVPEKEYHEFSLYEMEIDFKAECTAGDQVQTLVEKIEEGSGEDQVLFLHSLRRCDGKGGCTELVRARTSWRRKPPS